jgi:HPt (histidine-containing phosphotransfer) domain-containing protein
MDREPTPAVDAGAFASFVEMVGQDMPKVVVDILDTYCEEAAHLLGSIVGFSATGNLEEMVRPVHSLKSSSASVGALRLSAMCAELEQHLRGFGPEVDVGQHVRQIDAEHARVRVELDALRDEYASK